MEQDAYRQQFEVEDEHWWFVGRRAVIWSLLARAGIGQGVRILDAGCGTGRNVLEFGSLGPVRGIDPSPDAIEFARRRGVPGVSEGRLENLPFQNASFDLILATDVIEHVEDDGRALKELRRVGAPGGRLLLTVPAYRWLWSQHDEAHHHFRRYTLRALQATVHEAGWQPLVRTYFNSLLLAPVGAVRLLTRLRPASAPRSDLTLNPGPMNKVLTQPMRLEAAAIAHGARLPAGVSIGMVCAPA